MKTDLEIKNRPVYDEATSELETRPKSRDPYLVGDWVRFRKPHVMKGKCPYSDPLRVTKVLGNWTYRLANGQKWNARKLRRYFPPEEINPDVNPVQIPCNVPPTAEVEWEEIFIPIALPAAPAQAPIPVRPPRRSQRVNFGIPPNRLIL